MTMQRRLVLTATGLAAALALSACSGGSADTGSDSGDGVSLRYWLWDSNQQPAYTACVDAFEEENPGVTVTLEQYGWDDYWSTLTTGLVAGNAPDVFTSHLSYYPELASRGQLLPIDDVVESGDVDLDAYQGGLADLWVGEDGKRYGLPKDWDTAALFYNPEMLTEAGYTPEDVAALDWNPEDGGTYEDVIAHLTVDENGVRGDEPGFDKGNVAVYGLGLNASGGANGQTEWSMYAFSTGWTHSDTNPWGTEWNYADPRFKDTIAWFQSLAERGFMPTVTIAESGIGQMDAFAAGKYAMVTERSWNTKAYSDLGGVELGIAPVPAGVNGLHNSMFNGLGDNIAASTKHPEEAKALVAFLGSAQCQDLVAEHAVVFPAITTSADKAREAFAAEGIDVEPFFVPVEEDATHLAPVAQHWTEIHSTIMSPAMDAILSLDADVDSLDAVNDQINALFE